MSIDDTAKTDTAPEVCPRCAASGPTITLLTSMTRYLFCNGCLSRWQEPRPSAHDRDWRLTVSS